ncbi:MAG: SDR family oxidoreductase [Nocardioidaceae bacterium]
MGIQRVAVTGSTGRIGGRVAQHLADASVPTRLLVRDPGRAPSLPDSEVARAPYGDAEAVRSALEGVETVFMASASESEDRLEQHRAFVDGAVTAGVRHLVYLSFAGAGASAGFTLARDHGATEDHVRGSGLAWTFLRDNFYAEVFLDFAGPDHVIRGPADGGKVAAVAQDDVGAVAAHVLRDPSDHEGRVYELTGPEAVDLDQMAAILTTATGEPYLFHDETVDEARASRARYGAPDWQVDAWISTYTAIADGELATVSDDVPRLLGRAATPLGDVFGRIAGRGQN